MVGSGYGRGSKSILSFLDPGVALSLQDLEADMAGVASLSQASPSPYTPPPTLVPVSPSPGPQAVYQKIKVEKDC